MSETLFPRLRVCCACNAQTTDRSPDPGKPRIVAISLVIYRSPLPGAGKKQLAAAGRVQICEKCFLRAMSGGGLFLGREAQKFVAALRERLSARYSLMLADDGDGQPEPPSGGAPGLFEDAA